MITEGNLTPGNLGVIRFRLDGVVKTLNGPVTGNSLHAVAGYPDRLETADGREVPKNGDEFKIDPDSEFVTKISMGKRDQLNPEHLIPANSTVIDPVHGQTVQHVSDEEKRDIEERQRAEEHPGQ
jgi:hypothetical protein